MEVVVVGMNVRDMILVGLVLPITVAVALSYL